MVILTTTTIVRLLLLLLLLPLLLLLLLILQIIIIIIMYTQVKKVERPINVTKNSNWLSGSLIFLIFYIWGHFIHIVNETHYLRNSKTKQISIRELFGIRVLLTILSRPLKILNKHKIRISRCFISLPYISAVQRWGPSRARFLFQLFLPTQYSRGTVALTCCGDVCQ